MKKNLKAAYFIFGILLLFSCNRDLQPKVFDEKFITFEEFIKSQFGDSKVEELKLKYPEVNLTKDSLKYPFVFHVEFFLRDIIDFNTNQTSYILKADIALYNEKAFYTIGKDTLFDFSNKMDFLVEYDYEGKRDSDDVYITEFNYDGDFYHEKELDTMSQWSSSFEAKKFTNWQLEKYPFDVQTIELKIKSKLDSNVLRFKESKEYPADFVKKLSLPEGFYVSSIDFSEEFIEGSGYWPNGEQIKYSVATFSINIKRNGLSLFWKLFLGSILALILSVSVFYIPKGEFDAKSQISIGAVFAAVGNKYFVDSNNISNILTVADIINNAVIFLVIFNIFIMIAQRSEILNWKWLEEDVNAVKFSFLTISIITILILILYI